MKKTIAPFLGALLIWPAIAVSAAFTDPVRIESVSDAIGGAVTLVISPPGPLSEAEVSWPLCWTLRVRVPLEPEILEVTSDDHRAALNRLREAARSKERVYFGPAGKGLVPSKDDRCQLNSKAFLLTQRSDRKEAVISFHD